VIVNNGGIFNSLVLKWRLLNELTHLDAVSGLVLFSQGVVRTRPSENTEFAVCQDVDGFAARGSHTQYGGRVEECVHKLGRCCSLLVWLEVDKHVARAVADYAARVVWGAGGEFPVSLGGLDVAQGVESGTVSPASGMGGAR